MAYWLLKTEPEDYAYSDLVIAETDTWDGVRNHQAKNYLKKMVPGDQAFIYHTGREKAMVGIAEIVAEPFPDPTDPDFTAVSLQAVRKLKRPVTLAEIKKQPFFADWALVRRARLSVMPVTPEYWQRVLELAEEELFN